MRKSIFLTLVVILCTQIVFSQEKTAPKNLMYNSVPFIDVKFQDSFWAPRLKTNREISIPHNYKWCEDTGRFTNFAKAAKLKDGQFEGIYFNDSDVYKLLEGTAYSLADHPDPALKKRADDLIEWIKAAQEANGYLNTYYTLKEPNNKWANTRVMHELYCAGHLTEAAVAYNQATGDKELLGIAEKFIGLIGNTFGKEQGMKVEVPGHEEIELALVKLYKLTGEKKYLDLAEFFVDVRGDQNVRTDKLQGEYSQDHKPVREQDEIMGHAVRAMYLYAGVADVASYSGDEKLVEAMDVLWNDVVNKKMYITGGIGARHEGEAFGNAFELPNQSAYCETCAAIGLVFWAHRLNMMHGDARYADVVERAIYNGVLSGIGMDGKSFFYVNPLASSGGHHRQPFFDCACCPTNVVRFVPSLPGYQYAIRGEHKTTVIRPNPNRSILRQVFGGSVKEETKDGVLTITQNDIIIESGLEGGNNEVLVNQYVAGKSEVKLATGEYEIEQKTNYPWDGNVEISFKCTKKLESDLPTYTVAFRNPGWNTVSLNYSITTSKGKTREILTTGNGGNYFTVQFPAGESFTINIRMDMTPRRIVANPYVAANRGRVAIQRGPLVYCFEQCDNSIGVDKIVLAKDADFRYEFKPDLLGGVGVIKCKNIDGKELTAVPYYAWDHRESGKMAVWVRQDQLTRTPITNDPIWTNRETNEPILYKELNVDMIGRPENLTFMERIIPSASHCWGNDSVEAIVADITPKNSNDGSNPRMTFWPHKGSSEWVLYTFEKPEKVSSCSVYWFDDEPTGGCRIPKSWKISYLKGDDWVPVETQSEYSVVKNQYHEIKFTPVETTALRINVELQKDFSGGILSWKVK